MRVIALTLLLLGMIGAPAVAQSLDDTQKAVLVFDVRMDMLMSSKLGKQMDFEKNLSAMAAKPDPSKAERFFGAMSAPKNLEEVKAIQDGGALPFEFFARAKYKDAESAKQALEMSLQGSEEKIEKGGKTFYKTPEGGDVPPGLLMHMVDETTVELGTEAYIFHKDRDVFTKTLKAAWAKAPNEAIRLAMDIEGAKLLVAELISEGKANAPDPTFEAYYDLIDNIKDMGISIDLSSKNLLTLRTNAIDSENAEELKGGLDSLLLLARGGAGQGLQMLQGMGPDGQEMSGVLGKIVNAMKAKLSGSEVKIELPRPAGFEAAIQKAVPMLMMMGGGGGMGPPPGRPPSDR